MASSQRDFSKKAGYHLPCTQKEVSSSQRDFLKKAELTPPLPNIIKYFDIINDGSKLSAQRAKKSGSDPTPAHNIINKKEELNLNQEEGLQKYMQKKFVLLVQHLIA